MKQTIDQLIINSPYEEPKYYWKYDRESRSYSLEAGRCPTERIRRLSLTLRAPSYLGDTISARGKVPKKYVDNGEHRVDCEMVVMKQDGTVSVNSQATVILPSQV